MYVLMNINQEPLKIIDKELSSKLYNSFKINEINFKEIEIKTSKGNDKALFCDKFPIHFLLYLGHIYFFIFEKRFNNKNINGITNKLEHIQENEVFFVEYKETETLIKIFVH